MNKSLILMVGGIILVGTYLVGTIWGWANALGYFIGVFLVTLIILGRYALQKNFSLGTILYTNPTTWLYRVLNPHSQNRSRDQDDFFSFPKPQGPDRLEELPSFSFTKTTEEQRESNSERRKS